MVELASHEYRALVDRIADEIARLVPAPLAPAANAAGIARVIEHTLLAPDATSARIEQLCAEAERFGFAAVCVNPGWVALAVARLRSTPVAVATVVGFPLGATLGTAKRQEAAECLKLGADELDMVINIGALKSGLDAQVEAEIRGVVELAHPAGARVKAILETALLGQDEKIRACRLAVAAGADYVKTSTGFIPGGGATVADVVLLAATVGDRAAVKAAGGIRTLAELQALVEAGAARIGTSHALAIMAELQPR